MTACLNIHATGVAIAGVAVLLRGASGAGKSDLALRLIDGGAVLIADDRVDLTLVDGRLLAAPPATIAGLIEVRGVGLLRMPWVGEAPVGLVVDLVDPSMVSRLPDPQWIEFLSISIPLIRLDPWPASAALKVRLAVSQALLDK